MASCKECAQPITWVQGDDGRWQGMEPGTEDLHWLHCSSDGAKRRRTRAGLEVGRFPVSMSRLLLYRRCPRAYKRRYLDKIPDRQTPAMQLGSEFHKYIAALLKGEEPETPHIPMELISDFDRMARDVDGVVWERWERDKIVGVEEMIVLEWQDEAVTVVFEGIVDLLLFDGTTATIVDHKTGWDVGSEVALHDDLQAKAYALLVCRKYPQLERLVFVQVHHRFGGRTVSTEFAPWELEVFEGALRVEVSKVIRDTDFRPSPACETCPVGAHEDLALDLYRDVRIVTANGEISITLAPIETPEQAAHIAAGARFADVIAAACKAELREWTKVNGPVLVTAEGGYGHHEKVKRSCTDIKRAIEILEAADLDPNDYIRLDLTAAKPLLGAGARSVPELQGLVESSLTTEFGWKTRVVASEETAASAA